MKINFESTFLSDKQIKIIEEKYNAKYIYETQLMGSKGWTDSVGCVFYQENPPAGYSNWFAFYQKYNGSYVITSAEETVKHPVTAVKLSESKYCYSHYRHHYVHTEEGIDIDGGREYTRLIGRIHDSVCSEFIPTSDGLVIFEREKWIM